MNGPVIATLAVGVIAPFIAVLFGVILSNQRIARLETTVESRLEAFRNEMIALRNSIHADMVGIHECVAKVETRQGL